MKRSWTVTTSFALYSESGDGKQNFTGWNWDEATEYLFLENLALKLLLEHCQVANWQKLLDHLLSDKEMMAGVRLKFSDLYRELEASKGPSSVLNVFLGGLPAAKKPH